MDRNSAYEQLAKRAGAAAERQAPVADDRRGPWSEPAEERRTPARHQTRASSRRDSVGTAMAKSVVRSVGSAIGRELVRGILGSLRRSGRR